MIIVFYDGRCSVCNASMRYFKKIAPKNIIWKDIFKSEAELRKHKITLENALKIIHLVDENKKIFKGVDAFIKIWSYLKGWSILAKVISFPIIKQICQLCYMSFAKIRPTQHKICKIKKK